MKSIMPLIIIVICVGMYFAYISPMGDEVKSLSSDRVGYENILSKTRELAETREDILTVYNGIPSTDIERLNKIIPETFSAVIFLNDISNRASANGMGIANFRTNEPKAETRSAIINQSQSEFYKTTVVTFTLVGSYNQFLQFLNELESSLRLMDVVGISMRTGSARPNGDATLEYTLEIKTYSLR